GKDAALRIDGRDDASAIGAVALLVKTAAAPTRIDVMPARGDTETRRVTLAQAIGPACDTAQRRLVLALEQKPHLAARVFMQPRPGKVANHAMAECGPRLCRRRQQPHQQHPAREPAPAHPSSPRPTNDTARTVSRAGRVT